ncbi:UPF0146 family protein [Halomarina oriensis]|uniref:UPF0146 protein GQS65_13720 n=1 Tax=Halomarina oriensis TaxID=671145 RepID=A0A6B0GNK3_9EURY|nr:hypothetical protein [Halomarina oriensis]
MRPATRDALVDRLARYERLVEVGVGNRSDVAAALAERASVTATDVHDRPVPDGVRFVRDDVTDPDESVYRDADVIYALNLPPELHRPAWDLARRVDAAFLFTTLGGDGPSVPTIPETLPGETLFRARRSPLP